MEQGAEVLLSWKAGVNDWLTSRGVPVVEGRADGVSMTGLEMEADAASLGGAIAVLEVASPLIGAWESEDNDGEGHARCVLSFRTAAGWEYIECKAELPVDSEMGLEADGPYSVARGVPASTFMRPALDDSTEDEVRGVLQGVAEEMVASDLDGRHPDFRALYRLLMATAAAKDPRREAEFRAFGKASGEDMEEWCRHNILMPLSAKHRRGWRSRANEIAEAILEAEPELRVTTMADLKGIVRERLREEDPTCASLDASSPIAVELQRMVKARVAEAGLF